MKNKDKNSFLISCISCIVLLLVMCYFGVTNSSSLKGTMAADTEYTCPTGSTLVNGEWCCSNGYTTKFEILSGKNYCVNVDSTLYNGAQGGVYCRIGVSSENEAASYEATGKWECEAYTTPGGQTAGQVTYYCDNYSCAVEATRPLNYIGSDNEWRCFQESDGGYIWKYGKFDSGKLVENSYCMDYDSGYGNRCYRSTSSGLYFWGNYSSMELVSQYVSKADCLANNRNIYLSSDNGNQSRSCQVEPGETSCKVTLPGDSVEGETWLGWNTKEDCTGINYPAGDFSITASNNKTTLYSCFEDVSTTFKGTFYNVSSDEKLVVFAETTCEKGDNNSCLLPIPEKQPSLDGYTFKGWSRGAGCSGFNDTSFTVSANTNYYACYVENSYDESTIVVGTFMVDDKEYETKTCQYKSGENSCVMSIPESEPSKSNYSFKGWGTTKNCTSGTKDAFSVSEDVTRYACWGSQGNGNGSLDNPPSSEPSSSKPSSSDESSSSEDYNITDAPVTGEIAIAITWFMGLFAIAYSVYYFRRIKEK